MEKFTINNKVNTTVKNVKYEGVVVSVKSKKTVETTEYTYDIYLTKEDMVLTDILEKDLKRIFKYKKDDVVYYIAYPHLCKIVAEQLKIIKLFTKNGQKMYNVLDPKGIYTDVPEHQLFKSVEDGLSKIIYNLELQNLDNTFENKKLTLVISDDTRG